MKYKYGELPKDLISFDDAVQTRMAFSDRRNYLIAQWFKATELGISTDHWASAIQACTIAEENMGFRSH